MRVNEILGTNRPRPRYRRSPIDLDPCIQDLAARLRALEFATDRAADLLVDEDWCEAASAWRTISLVTDAIFGSDYESTIDAMRIAALAMSRAGMHEEARSTLCVALERILNAGGDDTSRSNAIRREIEGSALRALS